MSLKKGSFTYTGSRDPGGIRNAQIHGVKALHIETQAELDALNRAAAEGRPLALKPAPGQKPPRQ
jgi:hypothetical protein